ncbi:MAG: hypothetical protein K9K66_19330 [Desulfarculaceae bacterium]|nr:hypothetical protein [Desulfarculaceae bacterium]MCF8074536.1 hypothetical protein [Desulfarculaceae bacterium]MCF8103810.1 hypothetical protein [Desulfarculaceae bacterium]MCF8117818.1 hypothetical protein [Desulfarculaceae bacterium]
MIAWLMLGVMLYAGGLGHLLHPWLHQHASPRQHHLEPKASGPSLRAQATLRAHGPCALCAFLAHFVARKAEPALGGAARLTPLGRPFTPGQARYATAPGRLPGSRSPPRPPAC